MAPEIAQSRTLWLDIESQFRRLLGPEFGERLLQITFCGGEWTISAESTIHDGPEVTLQKTRLKKLYRSAAEAAGIAAGAPNQAQALDWWLNLLQAESPHFHPILGTHTENGVSVPDKDGGWILNGALAAAEMCIELANRASTTVAPTADEPLTSRPTTPPPGDIPTAQSSSTTPASVNEDWDGWVEANIVPNPNLHKHLEYPRCVHNWTSRTSRVVNSQDEHDALGPDWVKEPLPEQAEARVATIETPKPAQVTSRDKREVTADDFEDLIGGKDAVTKETAAKALGYSPRTIVNYVKADKLAKTGNGLITTESIRRLKKSVGDDSQTGYVAPRLPRHIGR